MRQLFKSSASMWVWSYRRCSIASTSTVEPENKVKPKKYRRKLVAVSEEAEEKIQLPSAATIFVDAAEIRGYHLKGIGAFWGDGDHRNLSLRLGTSAIGGYLTVNQVTLQAINIVLYQAITENLPAITVKNGYLDNFSYVDGLLNRRWLKTWEKNKWRKSKNAPIVEGRIDLFEMDILTGMIQVQFDYTNGSDKSSSSEKCRDLAHSVTEETMTDVEYKEKHFADLYDRILRIINDKYPPGPPTRKRKTPTIKES